MDAFVEQTNVQLLYPYELANSARVNAVNGSYTVQEALNVMFRGTSFSAGLSEKGTVSVFFADQQKSREDQMGGIKLKSSLLASVSAFIFGIGGWGSGVAVAQDVPVATDDADEIVVLGRRFYSDNTISSTKLSQSVAEAPQSITVLDSELLDDLARDSYVDLARFVPGLSVSSSEFGPYVGIRSRGFGVGIKINAQDLPDSKFFDNVAVERVDFVRGASGTTFGASGPGGFVNVVTRRGTDEFQGEAAAEINSFGRLRGEATISGPITSDGSVRGVIAGAYEGDDTQFEVAERTVGAVYGSVTADLTDRLTFTGIGYFSDEDNTPFSFGTPAQTIFDDEDNVLTVQVPEGLPKRRDTAALWSNNSQEVQYLYGEIGYEFSPEANLLLIVSDAQNDNNSEASDVCCNVELDGTTEAYYLREIYEEESRVYEFRLSGLFEFWGASTQYLLNGTWTESGAVAAFNNYDFLGEINVLEGTRIGEEVFAERNIVRPGPFTEAIATREEFRSLGLTTITDVGPLSVTLGIRYDDFEVESTSFSGDFEAVDFNQTLEDDQFSYRAAVTYEVVDDGRFYYSFNQSFLPGGGQQCDNTPFPPFTADIHEVGFKYRINKNLLATIAAYDISTSPGEVRLPIDTCPEVTINPSGPSYEESAQGIEAGLTGQITDSLNIIAAYAYTDRVAPEPFDFDGPRDAANRSDVPQAQVPLHQFSLFTVYDFPESGLFNGVGIGGGLVYESAQDLTQGPIRRERLQFPSTTVFDLALYYSPIERLNMTLSVNNLFDEVLYQSALETTEFQLYRRDPRVVKFRVEGKF
ncbi:MAG: TonB-dependent receptor [Pseudomonadota bacterium]